MKSTNPPHRKIHASRLDPRAPRGEVLGRLTVALVLAAGTATGTADDEGLVPGSTAGAAFIFVDNPNGKFGEYNGLDEDNGNFILNVDASWRAPYASENYWNLDVHNLGLDTFFMEGEVGQQGRFAARVGYDQLQKVYHDDAITIYDNALNVLAQPREITTRSTRKTLNAGLDAFLDPRLKFTSAVRSQTKDGQRPRPVTGGLIVPQDLDFRHDEFETSLSYSGERLQWSLAGNISKFENNNFDVLGTSTEPDNSFFQVKASGGYQLTDTSRATALVAYSQSSQDDDYSNYGIAPGTLSTDSPDLENSTLNLRLGYRNRVTRKLSLNANYRFESRNSDSSLYADFPSDLNNKVYEWDEHKLDAHATYRLPARWRAQGGFLWEEKDYDVSKVPRATGRLTEQAALLADERDELTGWVELRTPQFGGFNGQIKYAYTDRDVDLDPARELAASVDPGGVALSSYLIDRTRNKVDLTLNHELTASLSASFNSRLIFDDYDEVAWAQVDRQDSAAYTLDVNYAPTQKLNLGFYAGYEDFDIKQSGFGTLGDPATRWEYRIEDRTKLFGASAKLLDVGGYADLTINYSFQEGSGDYETFDAANVSGSFPDLDTTIHRLTVEADFDVGKHAVVTAGYLFEDYDSDSWVWENDFGESGSTYFNVLNYGYDSPVETTHAVWVGLSYKF